MFCQLLDDVVVNDIVVNIIIITNINACIMSLLSVRCCSAILHVSDPKRVRGGGGGRQEDSALCRHHLVHAHHSQLCCCLHLRPLCLPVRGLTCSRQHCLRLGFLKATVACPELQQRLLPP